MNTKIFTQNNLFLMLALDQRGSFKRMLNPENPKDINDQNAIKIKKEIIQAGYSFFSGILIDQDYGFPAYQSCNKCEKPYLLPVEESGYEETNNERITQIKYSAEEINDMGASGVKLLVYFDPKATNAKKQIQTAKQVLEDTHSQNIPLFLEIVTYDENKSVAESVSMFLKNNVRADVFKLEYPGTPEKCQQITQMLGTTPWIMLTAGIQFETFCNHLDIATQNGCKGFLAGRSIWKEYVSMKDEKLKQNFLHNTFPQRFNKIINIVKNNQS